MANSAHPILTYYENELIIAEAQARKNATNEAQVALNAVRTGLAGGYLHGATLPTGGRNYEPYAMSDFSPTGIANPTKAATTQQAVLYEIVAQRYTIFLMQYEAFNDYRRLAKATPVAQLPIPLYVGNRKPQRLIYPQSEIATNPNVPAPLPDQFTNVPIF